MGSGWRREDVSKPSSNFILRRLTILSPTHSRCKEQFLTVIVLVCVEDSTEELATATVSYSQLLAHTETRSKGIDTL